jgi:hypothetical protein
MTGGIGRLTPTSILPFAMPGIGDTSINTRITALKIKFFTSILPIYKKSVADGIALFLPSLSTNCIQVSCQT